MVRFSERTTQATADMEGEHKNLKDDQQQTKQTTTKTILNVKKNKHVCQFGEKEFRVLLLLSLLLSLFLDRLSICFEILAPTAHYNYREMNTICMN